MVFLVMGIFELVLRLVIGFVLLFYIGYIGFWWVILVVWIIVMMFGVWRYKLGVW